MNLFIISLVLLHLLYKVCALGPTCNLPPSGHFICVQFYIVIIVILNNI